MENLLTNQKLETKKLFVKFQIAYKMVYKSQQIIRMAIILLISSLALASCENDSSQSFLIDTVCSEVTDTICFDEDLIITGIDVTIQGDVLGSFQINLQDGDSYMINKKFQSTTDTSFYIDWYTSQLIIHYSPDSIIQGKNIVINILPHVL